MPSAADGVLKAAVRLVVGLHLGGKLGGQKDLGARDTAVGDGAATLDSLP